MRRDDHTDPTTCGHPSTWWRPTPTGPRVGDTHCLECAREQSCALGYVKPRRHAPARWSE